MKDFEQKLAAFRPKMLRNIELDPPELVNVRFEPNREIPMRRYVAVSLASFLLGVAATYYTLTPTETPSKSVVAPVASVILDDRDVEELRSPRDLTQLLARKTPLVVKKSLSESRDFQYRALYLDEIELLERRQKP